ncbi:ExbD/TolR family protein [Treponema phagedenis]|uniref:Biopolymer transporter ExbD n=1 Tax=Treponema phagedenis TaxID=162 RepID=A0AAE6IW14_TREPH|nr:biopolymer transporter ExbD [Treponema phagedenis]QEJ99261.1 biopolymer transporter ExbD [Treponema phagedenis]
MKRFKPERRNPEITITSLIDVVFILLIFFMIGSTFEKPVMKVALPEAESGIPVRKKSIEIIVDKAGAVYIGTQRYNLSELEMFLKRRIAGNPQASVFLSCDKDLPFKSFVEVMDVLNKSGVKNAAVKHDYPQH